MKVKFLFFIALLALSACNDNKADIAKLKTQVNQDSVLLVQSKQKDSAIASYISIMNLIEEKLDSVKFHEKILSVKNTPENISGNKTSIIFDIKSIDALILHYNKVINHLTARLKKLEKKDANMVSIISDLSKQLRKKEKEIIALQERLSLTSDSLRTLTSQFNDSLNIIKAQRTEINELEAEQNTVYYVAGTAKQLEKMGVIDEKGGFIWIGRTKELDPNVNKSIFIKTNKMTLKAIPLKGKFSSLITEHPNGTYNIEGKGKADTLVILKPGFWSKSKYLVVDLKKA